MIYNQINPFIELKLSKYLASFRKTHNTQLALLTMTETRHTMLNKVNKVGPTVMDFSKVFDTLNHNLVLCELKAYGFNTNALTFIQAHFLDKH